MSNRIIPKEQLTAYQRWELGALAAEARDPRRADSGANAAAQEQRTSGFEQGRREGLAAGRESAQQQALRLARVAEAAELALRGLSDQIANAVVELALVIARQVLRGEIQTTPGAILPAVREALGALPNSAHGARLLLNPADAQTVRDSLGDDLARLHARIVEDQHIAQGGCRLAASSGEIDATLETRWNAVAASIVGALARVERRPSGTERDQSDLPPEVLQ